MNDALVSINGSNIQSLEVLLTLTVITLLPSILVMMSSFTRIIIVLSILRNALGLQQTPPNVVLIGIALFLSLFIMSPVVEQINTEAYQPYKAEQITMDEAMDRAVVPIKEFMLKQADPGAVNMFMGFAKMERPEEFEDIPLHIVIPAFMTSELERAFLMGFLIFLPFLLIDIVVASTLMSMGMIMLPPVMISLPFKLLLFVVVHGWQMLFQTLVISFN